MLSSSQRVYSTDRSQGLLVQFSRDCGRAVNELCLDVASWAAAAWSSRWTRTSSILPPKPICFIPKSHISSSSPVFTLSGKTTLRRARAAAAWSSRWTRLASDLSPKAVCFIPNSHTRGSPLFALSGNTTLRFNSAAASLRGPLNIFRIIRPFWQSRSWGIQVTALSSSWHLESKESGQSFCQEVEVGAMDPSRNSMRSFQIVVAATRENGIGKDGTLPWSLPSDMKFFKQVTSETSSSAKKNAVVMGRNTWLSLPPKFRPLPGRLNVILSRAKSSPDFLGDSTNDVLVNESLYAALELLGSPPYAAQIDSVYVIGGGQVFSEAMASPLCDAIHFTEIESDIDCDTFCPAVDTNSFGVWCSSIPAEENGIRRAFVTYVRRGGNKADNINQKNLGLGAVGHDTDKMVQKRSRGSVDFLPRSIVLKHEEYQYLNLIRDIIETGTVKGDRTGTGTLSKFGCQMRFNLRKSFPLLTTKRVHWRGILEELLWFISGSTNAKVLQDKGIHIWDDNSSKGFLHSLGLTDREEGDLGPIYGFQWRHFGAKYTNMHADYSGQGVDQLADVIHKIRTNPDDRRIMLSAWNPADLHLMALPPCHMFAQFYVADGELSCQMYQRSCDMGLGVPYNIASYALLTCMIAHVCDLRPGDLVHVLGDAHVYKNHVEPLQQQLKHEPKPFPVLKIRSSIRNIDSFTAYDIELVGYESSKRIAMPMAV